MTNTNNKRGTESGNVLFLILIAVALFAALSYAVTQSTRGGGNADDETSLISSATLTQYPASLKTSILRMSISSGVADQQLEFNPPSTLGSCTVSEANCLFSSLGGGASYQQANSDVVTGSAPVAWVFNSNNSIEDIGSDGVAATNAETIAFLPGVTNGICTKINQELGITTGTAIPDETNIDVTTQQVNAYSFSAATGVIDDDASGVLEGQPFGCFSQLSINYYYHTLSEN